MSFARTVPFNAEPVLAGTLCLMSTFARCGCTRMAMKICDNLEWLATNPELSKEFRTVCARLLEQWEGSLSEGAAQCPAAQGTVRGNEEGVARTATPVTPATPFTAPRKLQ
jgi:hypothetical protein